MRRSKAIEKCTCACSCLRRAARAVTRLYDEAFRPMGYRATQVGILSTLAVLGPVTLSELADETVTDRTTLTRNLRLLEKKGLVCLECGADRRERRVCMTKKGSQLLQAAQPRWAQAQRKMIRRMGRKRFERLVADLSAVVAAARGG